MRNFYNLSVAILLMCMFSMARQSCGENISKAKQLKPQWPQITELTVKVHFDEKNRRSFEQIICNVSGAPLYVLDAKMPSDDKDDPAYDYSGAFDCRLCPYNPKNWGQGFPSLLKNVRNATRDWQTDGRFLNSEIIVLAGSNGSRFLVQRSRLRSMSVTIEISNVVNDENKGEIASFDVCFLFRNDPLAVSDIAAPPAEKSNKGAGR